MFRLIHVVNLDHSAEWVVGYPDCLTYPVKRKIKQSAGRFQGRFSPQCRGGGTHIENVGVDLGNSSSDRDISVDASLGVYTLPVVPKKRLLDSSEEMC